ncbi:MAG TPA: RNA-processing protein [Candidatus Diapherotrites archaeon]|uniref:RNA-processing protein n=1 Tax=Candidatus Iainarchaeum sp. TaxID=3101447 RepID=A0A7J4J3B1_9ARCH|nr:RNA-processing protein [Candidatus Diapherotrites archaeon]
MENTEVILVPHDRIGAIIGKAGASKRDIEKKTATELVIDSDEGEVEIIMKGDPVKYWKATRIVKAIGRGFSPEHALRLLNDDCLFELIELEEILGKNKSRMQAKKGRVIGAHGMAREEIERDTGANISVYGKTIGIIGKEEEIGKAKRAIEMLLGGVGHQSVFNSLRKEDHGNFEL